MASVLDDLYPERPEIAQVMPCRWTITLVFEDIRAFRFSNLDEVDNYEVIGFFWFTGPYLDTLYFNAPKTLSDIFNRCINKKYHKKLKESSPLPWFRAEAFDPRLKLSSQMMELITICVQHKYDDLHSFLQADESLPYFEKADLDFWQFDMKANEDVVRGICERLGREDQDPKFVPPKLGIVRPTSADFSVKPTYPERTQPGDPNYKWLRKVELMERMTMLQAQASLAEAHIKLSQEQPKSSNTSIMTLDLEPALQGDPPIPSEDEQRVRKRVLQAVEKMQVGKVLEEIKQELLDASQEKERLDREIAEEEMKKQEEEKVRLEELERQEKLAREKEEEEKRKREEEKAEAERQADLEKKEKERKELEEKKAREIEAQREKEAAEAKRMKEPVLFEDLEDLKKAAVKQNRNLDLLVQQVDLLSKLVALEKEDTTSEKPRDCDYMEGMAPQSTSLFKKINAGFSKFSCSSLTTPQCVLRILEQDYPFDLVRLDSIEDAKDFINEVESKWNTSALREITHSNNFDRQVSDIPRINMVDSVENKLKKVIENHETLTALNRNVINLSSQINRIHNMNASRIVPLAAGAFGKSPDPVENEDFLLGYSTLGSQVTDMAECSVSFKSGANKERVGSKSEREQLGQALTQSLQAAHAAKQLPALHTLTEEEEVALAIKQSLVMSEQSKNRELIIYEDWDKSPAAAEEAIKKRQEIILSEAAKKHVPTPDSKKQPPSQQRALTAREILLQRARERSKSKDQN